MSLKRVIQFFAFLFLASLVTFTVFPEDKFNEEGSNGKVELNVGDKFPEVTLKSIDGSYKKIDFTKSEITLFNVWATWCPPCQKEIPVINSYFNTYERGKFNVIALSMGEGKLVVEQYLENNIIAFPVFLDPQQKQLEKLAIQFIPTSYFVNSEGRVIEKHKGELSPDILDAILQKEL
ncbi:TlpA family protein disulfide reductase [Halobacillus fulvus]|nr:TlpA family protein disulfide reductase [Halobacillus fulvus]